MKCTGSIQNEIGRTLANCQWSQDHSGPCSGKAKINNDNTATEYIWNAG